MQLENDKQIFNRAITKGANIFIKHNGKNVRKKLFPIWRDAFHDFLKNHGCSCTVNDSSNCFLDLSEDLQKITPGEYLLSFDHFIDTIIKSKKVVEKELL